MLALNILVFMMKRIFYLSSICPRFYLFEHNLVTALPIRIFVETQATWLDVAYKCDTITL